jgi:hypothetical protein
MVLLTQLHLRTRLTQRLMVQNRIPQIKLLMQQIAVVTAIRRMEPKFKIKPIKQPMELKLILQMLLLDLIRRVTQQPMAP